MDLFREFLNDTGLIDMDLKGEKFTWRSNPRNGFVTREKIDRVLVNWPWRSGYPHALVLSLPMVTSDHTPLVLQLTPKNKSGVQFKYEAFWDDHEDCEEIIKQGWVNEAEREDEWEDFISRTKGCKKNLQEWHKRTFKRADNEIFRLKKRLADLTSGNSLDVDWAAVKRAQSEIDELWNREEKFWGQRSRLKWLK